MSRPPAISPKESSDNHPEAGAEEVRTGPGGGQLIRLTPEVVSSLAQGAGDAKLQFVRVVAGAGGLQSLQVKGGQVVNNIQGVRGVVTNNVKGLVVSSVFSYSIIIICR